MEFKLYKAIVEDRNDPLKLGRVRVRVIGIHTENKSDIPTEDLPWASVLNSVYSASMNGIGFSPSGLVEGSVVVVFFNNQEELQDPVVIGSLSGIPTGANFATNSDIKTTQEEQQAVFNGGKKPDGEKIEPLQKVSETGGRQIDMLIIHTTATKPSMDIGVAEIDDWHRQRGWSEIGYHAVIRRNGVIEQGRDISKIGAHAKGYNRKSIGVALVGGLDSYGNPENNFTNAQWQSLKQYVQEFMQANPKGKVIGHNQVSSKACPCFDVPSWLDRVFDDAKADENFLNGYDENQAIEGIPQQPAEDNKDDVGEVESFSEDVQKNRAVSLQKFTENVLGFNDPNGVYPKTTHLNEPDTSRWARNEDLDKAGNHQKQTRPDRFENPPKFTTAGGIEIQIPSSAYNAVYPYNHVFESESGHLIEIDDTPNAERLHQFHRTGTFEEIHPDGTRVVGIVGNDFTVIEKDGNLFIKGNVNVTVNGNVNLKVIGDVNIENDGKMNVQSKGELSLQSDSHIQLIAPRIDLN